jgi:hypothetical protein
MLPVFSPWQVTSGKDHQYMAGGGEKRNQPATKGQKTEQVMCNSQEDISKLMGEAL